MKSFARSLTRLIGVDIGGSTVRMWTNATDASSQRGDTTQTSQLWGGSIASDASCLAVERSSKRVLAIGKEALQMEGRVGQQVEVLRPFNHGLVGDWDGGLALLRLLGQHIHKPSLVFSTIAMVSVPAGATLAQRDAAVKLLTEYGAQEVYTIAQPLAAAIGAGVPIADASGSFMLHMGESVVEAAAISLGSLVSHEQTTMAGQHILLRLQKAIKDTYQLHIAPETTRELLSDMVSLLPESKQHKLVTGKDVYSGSPKELTIRTQDVYAEVEEVASRYVALIEKMLSRVQPELTVDVIDKGLLLTGGLAKIDGLEQFLTERMGVSAVVVDEPEQCVIRGIANALTHLDLFKESLGYQVVGA